ncbi:PQQ-like beta-propeller repeat protein [Streptomyces sp. DT2A-34]|uniref:PQQ-binding-like beta-propeller repeat protein n=1 Tax=Streptomyces sp. DT2A-34 TaxID=3051182 RepID=UPI00265C28E6|nr:PQQ-binding-like beta-propeller repeat protein [Streptomyces sp. DT2A-34]MDO0916729.1 PQQ-like beta-propeller repeat protein [Streptomyces sp. DT2A-34]
MRDSLSLTNTWLFGAGIDRVVWLRDARSGRLRWRTSVGKASSPDKGSQPHYPQLIVAKGQVLFGGGNGDSTGEVIALCAADGKHMWRRTLPGKQVFEIARSGDVVVAATQESIFGLSATTGKILWQAEVYQGRQIVPHGETLILLHQGGDSFGAAGLDRKTGKVLWSESILGTNSVEFRVAGDLVHVIGSRAVEEGQDDGTTLFVPTPGEVRTVSTESNHVQWTRTLQPLSASSSLAGEGFLYLSSGDRLLALNSDTGKTAWSIPLPEPEISPEMILHDGLLIVRFPVPDDGTYPVLGLDPKTGKERWRLEIELTAELISGPPGMVLTNTAGAKVIAIDTTVGEVIWSTPMKGAVQIAAADLVYAHDGEEITVYDVATGDLLYG